MIKTCFFYFYFIHLCICVYAGLLGPHFVHIVDSCGLFTNRTNWILVAKMPGHFSKAGMKGFFFSKQLAIVLCQDTMHHLTAPFSRIWPGAVTDKCCHTPLWVLHFQLGALCNVIFYLSTFTVICDPSQVPSSLVNVWLHRMHAHISKHGWLHMRICPRNARNLLCWHKAGAAVLW